MMKKGHEISSCLICILFTYAFFEGAIVESEANEISLPTTIDAWSRPENPRIVTSKNIFDYMNGAGELYLGYRFRQLHVFEYTSEDQAGILVELYFMETSDDAFGLLSLDWGGEIVSFGDNGRTAPDPSLNFSTGALYGDGLLRMWSDNLYVRVMADRETPTSKQAVLALGKAISVNQKSPHAPGLWTRIPDEINSSWRLRRDKLSFFRSYLALNSIYYLSHENILDLDLSAEGVMGSYEDTALSKQPRRSSFLVVKYENHERAKKALSHFHEAYLPEHEEGFTAGSAATGPRLFKIEDGWLGYRLIDHYVAIVFESPDQKTARGIIEGNESNLVK
jgi:hypothetical protein